MQRMSRCTHTETCPCPLCRLEARLDPHFRCAELSLSPDGRWAWLVSDSGGGDELWIIDANATEQHCIHATRQDDHFGGVSFHPTRRELCFVVGGLAAGLYLSSWPDATPRRLTGGPDTQPLWTGDDRIVFVRDSGHRSRVMVVDLSTRCVRALGNRMGRYLLKDVQADRVRGYEVTPDARKLRRAWLL